MQLSQGDFHRILGMHSRIWQGKGASQHKAFKCHIHTHTHPQAEKGALWSWSTSGLTRQTSRHARGAGPAKIMEKEEGISMP